MHKMRAKLYPSYLPGTEGKYIARTLNEAIVTIEDICASMKNRGGFDGSYEKMRNEELGIRNKERLVSCSDFLTTLYSSFLIPHS